MDIVDAFGEKLKPGDWVMWSGRAWIQVEGKWGKEFKRGEIMKIIIEKKRIILKVQRYTIITLSPRNVVKIN